MKAPFAKVDVEAKLKELTLAQKIKLLAGKVCLLPRLSISVFSTC
jgi:hypothetical protein